MSQGRSGKADPMRTMADVTQFQLMLLDRPARTRRCERVMISSIGFCAIARRSIVAAEMILLKAQQGAETYQANHNVVQNLHRPSQLVFRF